MLLQLQTACRKLRHNANKKAHLHKIQVYVAWQGKTVVRLRLAVIGGDESTQHTCLNLKSFNDNIGLLLHFDSFPAGNIKYRKVSGTCESLQIRNYDVTNASRRQSPISVSLVREFFTIFMRTVSSFGRRMARRSESDVTKGLRTDISFRSVFRRRFWCITGAVRELLTIFTIVKTLIAVLLIAQ